MTARGSADLYVRLGIHEGQSWVIAASTLVWLVVGVLAVALPFGTV
jgi:hypothetical protein